MNTREVLQTIKRLPHAGMMADVYKSKYANNDATNGGVTRDTDRVYYVGQDVPEVFSLNHLDLPVVEIIYRKQFNDYIAVPVDQPQGVIGPMFGGNFIYSNDSRFPSKQPIPVHDRFETPAQYERLSI